MADALEHGAHEAASKMDSTLDVVRRPAREATIEDLLGADGYLFCAPENLATVSGEFLEFCHRSYYHVFACEGSGSSYGETSQLFGRPYGLAIAAGSDGSGAARQVARICQGWRLRPVTENPLIVQNGLPQTAQNILRSKECPPGAQVKCRELGGLVAATILLREC